MPEQKDDRRIFSLLEVTTSVQKTLAERYTSAFWVKAEMNKLNPHPPSGHCYPELVEKKDGRIIAEINANLWRDDYRRINQNFIQVLKEPLKSGITILLYAKIAYEPLYGLRLRILDIDPSYALGELEREKLESIDRLKKEGIFDANRTRTMPLLPKRIAVISVQTSKGYSDFVQTIDGNGWGYRFFHMLFPAILQGERSASSIIAQLRNIRKVLSHFDVVAIIRGGGGEVGLTCYNDLALSREIALFPIPVLTGIGHSTNETVSEMVAFRNAITPTDLADYLLQKFHNYAVPVQRAADSLADRSRRLLRDEGIRLLQTAKYFRASTASMMVRQEQNLLHASRALRLHGAEKIRDDRQQLLHLEKAVSLLDPQNVLKRGYSITRLDGHLVTNIEKLKEGDTIQTTLTGGTFESTVTAKNKNNE